MNPTVSTPETRRRGLIHEFAAMSTSPTYTERWRAICLDIVKLGPDATADEIDAVLIAAGKRPEARKGRRCDCCEKAAEKVVTTGPRSDRLTLCADCLREALAVLEAAP